jgi:hypothetical protein
VFSTIVYTSTKCAAAEAINCCCWLWLIDSAYLNQPVSLMVDGDMEMLTKFQPLYFLHQELWYIHTYIHTYSTYVHTNIHSKLEYVPGPGMKGARHSLTHTIFVHTLSAASSYTRPLIMAYRRGTVTHVSRQMKKKDTRSPTNGTLLALKSSTHPVR